MDRQISWREGMTVYGADGDKVGKVVAVDPAYVVVEKGFFFPTDYYIPTSAIASATEDDIYLTVTKDQALNQGWDQPLTTTYDDDARYQATTTEAEAYAATGAGYTRDTAGSVDVEDRERVAVPVHEEELQAVKRERDLGTVRIEKDVVTEERTIDVPVTEERVRVRHVAPGEAAADDTMAFEEGVIEVPLHGEEVVVDKRTRRAGDVVIEKETVQRTERVGGTVRREQVRVDDETVQGADFVDEAGRDTPR